MDHQGIPSSHLWRCRSLCQTWEEKPRPRGLGRGQESPTASSLGLISCKMFLHHRFSSVPQSCLTLCDHLGLQHSRLPCPSPTTGACSKFMSIESVMPSNHPIFCRPLLLPSIFPSIRVFSNESVLHIRWPKDWSFSLSISPSNEYSGLLSFRIDWLDLLAVKGLSRVFSNSRVQKHQFFNTQLYLRSSSHIHTWLLEKP